MSRLAALCLWFVLSLSWSNVQVPGHARAGTAPLAATIAQASSTTPASAAKAAIDGNRFATDPTHSWQGTPAERCWWWQVRFPQERTIGAILQIQGDHAAVFRNAPRHYLWQASLDGQAWQDLKETEVTNERRLFRIHRLSKPCQARFLRLSILEVEGTFPTLREVEFFADAAAAIPFGDWIIAVDTTGESRVPRHGDAFIPLARSCKGWQGLQAQQLCHRDFDEAFVAAEPRPLCVFLSGNFKDWCEVPREPWRGTQQVLQNRNFPMCGFSAATVQIFDELGAQYGTVDVLSDPELREQIKVYSNWPTIPQVYLNGKFLGGCGEATQAVCLSRRMGILPDHDRADWESCVTCQARHRGVRPGGLKA